MTYFGGKAQDGVYQTIINQIPPHERYIEAFLGGGAIMILKRPATVNIGIDLDAKALEEFSIAYRQKRREDIQVPCRQKCLEDIYVIQTSALDFLRSSIGVNTPDTFIYCDPPYPLSTRSCPDRCRYTYEMTDAEHHELLDILKSLNCQVMISTYPNMMYTDELEDWRFTSYTSVTRSGDPRLEHIYMNYPEPEILHDDRYLGADANNRQDINRRIARTKKRLLHWPKPERLKMLRQLLGVMGEDEREYLSCSIDRNTYTGS